MKNHKPSFIVCLIVTLTCVVANGQDKEFVPLFNGKDLDGWRRVNTDERTWSIEDEMLVCSGKPIGELRTLRMYQNFILEVEWRHMKPRGNAGIFIWADDITAKGQPFHRGIEIQVLENAYGNTRGYTTHGDIFPIHGAKMKPVNGRGGSRAFPTQQRSNPSPQWNHYRIEAVDGEVSLAVNGEVVTRGLQCNPRKGYICIESEGGIVHYRNMRIKELPDTPVDEKMIAIAERGYRCLYTGIDLKGWKAEESGGWESRDWILRHNGPNLGTIQSEESFDEFGFLVDVRFQKDASVRLGLGKSGYQIELNPSEGKLLSYLAGRRNWTRLEGEVRDGTLSLRINDRPVQIDFAPTKTDATGLVLSATGTVDLANIYVKQ